MSEGTPEDPEPSARRIRVFGSTLRPRLVNNIMTDQTEQLRTRLQALLAQVERDRASLQHAAEGRAVYSKLFDSLTATLHNLDRPPAAEKRVD